MTETAKAIYKFCSGFGIPAYVEDSVPIDAELPYLTYSFMVPDWTDQGSLQIRLWYKNASYTPVNAKISEISNKVGDGLTIGTNTGCVALFKASNFAQYQPYDDQGKSNIKVAYLTLLLNAYTK